MEPEEKNEPKPTVGTVTEPPKPKSEIPTMETYKTDIAEAIRREHMSAIKIAASQQGKIHEPGAYDLPGDRGSSIKKIAIIAVSLLLIVSGGAALTYSFLNRPATGPSATPNTGTPIENITFEAVKTMIVPKDEIQFKQILTTERNTGELRLSSATKVVLATGTLEAPVLLSAETLFSYLGPRTESSFIRALGEHYAFGFHMTSDKEPFLVVAIDSYDHAYAGMLAWEQYMEDDLSPAFYTKETRPVSVGTSTPVIANNTFSDLVINNKDVRAVRRADGAIKLLYSFPDKKTLIITTNETTFKNLVARLRSAELAR